MCWFHRLNIEHPHKPPDTMHVDILVSHTRVNGCFFRFGFAHARETLSEVLIFIDLRVDSEKYVVPGSKLIGSRASPTQSLGSNR